MKRGVALQREPNDGRHEFRLRGRICIEAVTPQTQEIIESMGRYRKIEEGLT